MKKSKAVKIIAENDRGAERPVQSPPDGKNDLRTKYKPSRGTETI